MLGWRKYFFYLIIATLFTLTTSCSSKKLINKKAYRAKQETRYIKNRLKIEVCASNKTDQKAWSLYREAYYWIGTPYKYGGLSTRGIDCSGLALVIYQRVYNRRLPRTTQKLSELKIGHRVNKKKLKAGDLIFFKTNRGNKHQKVNHVGIYLKNGYFIHASSHGVKTSSMNEPYYKKTWRYNYRINKTN